MSSTEPSKHMIPRDFDYLEDAVITVRSHTPVPDPNDLPPVCPYNHNEARTHTPLERCVLHSPTSGTLGTSEITFKVAKYLRAGTNCHTQVLVVDILRNSSRCLSPSVKKVVAKLYDPLYNDYSKASYEDYDPPSMADKCYANEAAAYRKLEKLQGTVIPTFYGSYSLELPVGQRTSRVVRLNLIEYIPGDSLENLDPKDFTQKQRQHILKGIIDGESALFHHDVYWNDLYKRNVLVTQDSRNSSGVPKVTLIDFEISDLGRDAGSLPGTYVSPLCRWEKKWSRHLKFRDWIDWDYQPWLNTEWAHTNGSITPYIRSRFTRGGS